jgi:hypothetical protein
MDKVMSITPLFQHLSIYSYVLLYIGHTDFSRVSCGKSFGFIRSHRAFSHAQYHDWDEKIFRGSAVMFFIRNFRVGIIKTKDTMTNNSIPLVEARGTYREVGRQIGTQCKPQIQSMLAHLRKHVPAGFSWEQMLNHSKEYLAPSRTIYPQYVEELE